MFSFKPSVVYCILNIRPLPLVEMIWRKKYAKGEEERGNVKEKGRKGRGEGDIEVSRVKKIKKWAKLEAERVCEE